jgi:hypothetical protein
MHVCIASINPPDITLYSTITAFSLPQYPDDSYMGLKITYSGLFITFLVLGLLILVYNGPKKLDTKN